MKAETKKLLAEVEKIHDFDSGYVRGEGGNRLRTTCVCRLCAITWDHWCDQNGAGTETTDVFHTHEGRAVNLRQAAKECK